MQIGVRVKVIVFNADINLIPVISWQLDLLVEETGVSRVNHRPTVSQATFK
jgi:hypothetical protein